MPLDPSILPDWHDAEIQGVWEVVDARRSGMPEPWHAGARITFAGKNVP